LAVLLFDWNTLRAQDKVLVHEAVGSHLSALTGGVVVSVETGPKANRVGITSIGDEPTAVHWPAREAVHRDPLDLSEPCWRCDRFSAGLVPATPAAMEHTPAGDKSRGWSRRLAAPA
jgi:hypothetical protein